MAIIGKCLCLCLIAILAVSSLMIINSVNAQTIPKPSVPEFTLRYVNNSYVIPETTTYSTNPYTGEQKAMRSGGYLFKNTTIEIIVKSQSYPSSINDTSLQLYYNVRAKGYYEQNWSNLNIPAYAENTISTHWLGYLPLQQNSEYTIISIPANTYPVGGNVDFQVRAILGGDFYIPSQDSYPYTGFGRSDFVYETSDWGNTQSVTIPKSTAISMPSPTVPEFPITATLIAVLVVISLLLVVGKRR